MAGICAGRKCVGSVGDSFDNALAGTMASKRPSSSVRRNRIMVQELGGKLGAAPRIKNTAMTDRSCMLTIICATTIWFVVRVGMHWYFGVW